MKKHADIRAGVNREKRNMLQRGTTYRKKTAIYASRLLNDLVISNLSLNVTRQELVELVKEKYNLDDERANDVAKNIHVHLRSANDRVRLAHHYQKADQLMKNKKSKES